MNKYLEDKYAILKSCKNKKETLSVIDKVYEDGFSDGFDEGYNDCIKENKAKRD